MRFYLSKWQEEYDVYYDWYGESQFNFGNILHSVIGNLREEEDLDSAIKFFSNRNLGLFHF